VGLGLKSSIVGDGDGMADGGGTGVGVGPGWQAARRRRVQAVINGHVGAGAFKRATLVLSFSIATKLVKIYRTATRNCSKPILGVSKFFQVSMMA
jgi:hypothetical protein